MDSITVEFPRNGEPAWLAEMVDEFTEDPYCHLVMVGADERGVVLTTMWSTDVSEQVAASLAEMVDAIDELDASTAVRRMELSVPTLDGPGL